VHRNILLGAAAWLLGAATATAGCLLAVSLLGSGITSGGSGQLLSQDAANRELASEAAKSAPGHAASADPDPTLASVPPSPRSPSASAARPSVTAPGSPTADSLTAGATDSPTAGATGSGDAVATDTAPSGSAPPGTVLASSAGTVVATCQAAGAYLISWSPQQGYEVGDVFRGPAAAASVQFESHADELTMTVSCSDGVPSATTSTGGGGDD
jgi:eukaryotic-like serine/threonine-protein kinase